MQIRIKNKKRPAHAAAALAALMAGCGGGGGGGSEGGAASTAAASAGGLSPEAAQFIVLDMANLPDYQPQLPPHYAGVKDNVPAGTTPSAAVASLGRVLFHDRQLSVSRAVSCASCHRQDTDFGDADRFSLGFDGGRTTAHSMRLANVRFSQPGTMFWDRRAASLEAQSTLPVQHPVEMGFDEAHGGMPAALQRVAEQPYYPELFGAAFGDRAITEDRMQQALAQFLRAMVSTNSRWDTSFAQVFDASATDKGNGKPLPGFSPQEDRGRHLFMASRANGGQACAACHAPPTFAATPSGSNGLDAGETRRFKSPSLKNVARSGAFMHDGRFSTLEQVVEHYSSGVLDGPSLDNRLKGADGLALKPALSQDDKDALVAFLRTLDDPVLAADGRFSNPFRAEAQQAAP